MLERALLLGRRWHAILASHKSANMKPQPKLVLIYRPRRARHNGGLIDLTKCEFMFLLIETVCPGRKLNPLPVDLQAGILITMFLLFDAGYGHIAPKTHWGRMITIVYALIGIPLTFLYLSNMGNLMAKCFRIFYQKVIFE
jgi:Ion channel